MKKKGFTLIELLAVIVILAIIALISTPIIIGVIEKARRGAFEDSAYGVLDASRIYFIGKLADDNKFAGATFTFPEGGDLKISGEKPGGGTVILDTDGTQAIAVYDKEKKWCALKGYNEEKITIKDYKEEECKVEAKPITTSDACFDFDASTKTITQYHFGESGCGTNVVIPNTIGGVIVEHIGDNSFNGENINVNQKLTSVVFPSEIISIGESAFSYNRLFDINETLNLENFTKLKTIKESAFDSYSRENRSEPSIVILPSNIETVGHRAFGHYCEGGRAFTIQYKLGNMNLDIFKELITKAAYGASEVNTLDGYHTAIVHSAMPC